MPSELTQSLDTLKAVCEKATRGPWKHLPPNQTCLGHQLVTLTRDPDLHWTGKWSDLGSLYHPENMTFAATSRTALPALIRTVETLAEAMVNIEGGNDDLPDCPSPSYGDMLAWSQRHARQALAAAEAMMKEITQ